MTRIVQIALTSNRSTRVCIAPSAYSIVYIRVCCHSNATQAPIANPLNSAQPEGTSYPSPKSHPSAYSSGGMQHGTDIQTAMTSMRFASAMPQCEM